MRDHTDLTHAKPTRDPALIIEAFVRLRGLNRTEILGGISKVPAVVTPRHELMWLLRDLTNLSYADVGKVMGGRDYATVAAGVTKVATRAEADPVYRDQLAAARHYILSYDPAIYEPRLDAASVLARRILMDRASDPVTAQPLAIAMLSVAAILRSAELSDAEARQAALSIIQNAKGGEANG